jgi:hypothetical protein
LVDEPAEFSMPFECEMAPKRKHKKFISQEKKRRLPSSPAFLVSLGLLTGTIRNARRREKRNSEISAR